MKTNNHPCGLSKTAVRQHETGSRRLGKAGALALLNWEEAERLRERIEELQAEKDFFLRLIKKLNK